MSENDLARAYETSRERRYQEQAAEEDRADFEIDEAVAGLLLIIGIVIEIIIILS